MPQGKGRGAEIFANNRISTDKVKFTETVCT